ncbi:MAG: amidophosphoribosyltransferase [Verrucomicrobia bacterium]|nr:amidophosphoribosyltransferase [Verrucomicrobiota bacterium]
MKKIFLTICLAFALTSYGCGVALVRLRQPIGHYVERYDDPAWGIKKLLFLLEKQRNRGQDGTGVSILQFNVPPGQEYFHHFKSASPNSLDELAREVSANLKKLKDPSDPLDDLAWKNQSPFIGEILLGHLRYATHAGLNLKYCQPYLRPHYIPGCQFALAGNFNMTNTPDLFKDLSDQGLVLSIESDTQVILDTIAYQLDRSYDRNLVASNGLPVSAQQEIESILKQVAKDWDGGYVFCGVLGTGDLFACRDPAGIRPGYYFINEEVVAVASEKSALMEAFDLESADIVPIKPGHALLVKKDGDISQVSIVPELPQKQCSFERIYFSKANDDEIYSERKALGRNLAPRVIEALDSNLGNVVFTYVPNSSISAFQGLIEGVNDWVEKETQSKLKKGTLSPEDLNIKIRAEHIIAKNQKIRTFISSDMIRNSLVTQLYEVTKGIVKPEDTLVVLDDSIIRGTTLRESLIPKLLQLKPKKIILVSSAPPVLYPDCYGIDMSQLGRFVGFQAAISMLRERDQEKLIDEVRHAALRQKNLPPNRMQNCLKKVYDSFTLDELSHKISRLISPAFCKIPIQVIYQSIEGLHKAMPNFKGDWYFSGDYPTPGGYQVLNNSFLKWYLNDDSRSY